VPAARLHEGTALGRDGGILVNVGMRLIPAGIAALIAGVVFGLALPSEGRHEIGSADAELRAESPRPSVFGTIHPKRLDLPTPLGSQILDGARVASLGTDVAFASAVEETDRRSDPPGSMRQRMSFDERFSFDGRLSFDERFSFDQPSDSFDQRFAATADETAGAPAMTAETEGTGSVPNIARSPSPDPGQHEMAQPAVGRSAPRLASLASAPPAPAKKIRLASLEMPKGSSWSLDPDSRTAIYDITARTVYMPDGRRLEAHSGLGDRMDDPRYVNVRREGPTPPNVYDLSLRENLFHGVRAIRLNPVGDGKMYGRDGMLAHSYLLGPSGESNGCVSFSDYPAFLNAFLRGEVTRLVVVERLATPPSSQIAGWLPKFLKDLFSGPERTAASQPESAIGYAAVQR
jgi:Tlde1 domain